MTSKRVRERKDDSEYEYDTSTEVDEDETPEERFKFKRDDYRRRFRQLVFDYMKTKISIDHMLVMDHQYLLTQFHKYTDGLRFEVSDIDALIAAETIQTEMCMVCKEPVLTTQPVATKGGCGCIYTTHLACMTRFFEGKEYHKCLTCDAQITLWFAVNKPNKAKNQRKMKKVGRRMRVV